MKLAEAAPHLAGQLEDCRAGNHEACAGEADTVDRLGVVRRMRCACGCHRLNPWPWPCADDHPVLLLMANLQRSLDAATEAAKPEPVG